MPRESYTSDLAIQTLTKTNKHYIYFHTDSVCSRVAVPLKKWNMKYLVNFKSQSFKPWDIQIVSANANTKIYFLDMKHENENAR